MGGEIKDLRGNTIYRIEGRKIKDPQGNIVYRIDSGTDTGLLSAFIWFAFFLFRSLGGIIGLIVGTVLGIITLISGIDLINGILILIVGALIYGSIGATVGALIGFIKKQILKEKKEKNPATSDTMPPEPTPQIGPPSERISAPTQAVPDDQAIPNPAETIRLAADTAKAKNTLAAGYFHNGIEHYRNREYDAAITAFSQTLRLAPNTAKVYYVRGGAFANIGDYDRASIDFNAALRIDPHNAKAQEGLEQLRKLRPKTEEPQR